MHHDQYIKVQDLCWKENINEYNIFGIAKKLEAMNENPNLTNSFAYVIKKINTGFSNLKGEVFVHQSILLMHAYTERLHLGSLHSSLMVPCVAKATHYQDEFEKFY